MDWRMPALIGYLIGSVSWAVIIGRLTFGIDVRRRGSRNAGGANAGRVMGLGWGVLVAALDVGKGMLATLVGAALVDDFRGGLVAGVAAVVGHIFPVWFGFMGGKAIAAFAGSCVLAAPQAVIPAACTWVLCFVVSRSVPRASAVASALLPVIGFALGFGYEIVLYMAAMGLLICTRHIHDAVWPEKRRSRRLA